MFFYLKINLIDRINMISRKYIKLLCLTLFLKHCMMFVESLALEV